VPACGVHLTVQPLTTREDVHTQQQKSVHLAAALHAFIAAAGMHVLGAMRITASGPNARCRCSQRELLPFALLPLAIRPVRHSPFYRLIMRVLLVDAGIGNGCV